MTYAIQIEMESQSLIQPTLNFSKTEDGGMLRLILSETILEERICVKVFFRAVPENGQFLSYR
jgi:hypothetical protein